jgi:hypothetical protein
MMKVTKTTFNMIAANRAAANKNTVMIQRMTKSGKWGKAYETQRFGNETDEQVVERLIANNGVQFRIAE